MTWIYEVKSKSFYLNEKFKFKARYAGAPGYKDDTKYECVQNKGPLPRGKYRIVGKPFRHHKAGRFTLRLEPYASNNMCGRGGFLIHGDSTEHIGEASNGCIVANPGDRMAIWDSMDKELIVK